MKGKKKIAAFFLAASMAVTAMMGDMGNMAGNTMPVWAAQGSKKVQEIPANASGAIDFNKDWQFYLATRTPSPASGGFVNGLQDAGTYTTAQASAKALDDTGWRTVDVPHDFSIEGNKINSASDSQAYLQGGLGWYRKTFKMPAALSGKRITLDFEGVYQNSVVYLNGEKIGSYPNGYTGFAFDVTDKIAFGAENVLAVKVQNMSPSGRWYTGSGIIRPVHLLVDEDVRFNRNGIALRSPNLKTSYTGSHSASLEVEASAWSDVANANIRMEVAVFDAQGNEAARKRTENIAINGGRCQLSLTGANALSISNVKLWNPWNLGEPYLYKVRADLYVERNGSADGYVLFDSAEIEYGFRWVEVKQTVKDDPASGGLYINDKYTKIRGADLHHDLGALGAAAYADAYERQIAKLKEMGVNAYRTSHCPPAKQMIDACRREGILVVEEAFDGWGTAKATYDFGIFFFGEVPQDWAGLKPNGYASVPDPVTNYTGAKFVWSDWVIMEMVKRDQNEPSVIAWSLGNEIRGVGQAAWYRPSEYDILSKTPGSISVYTEAVRLMRDVKAVDAARFVVMGGDQERAVPGADSDWGLVNQILDGYGLNYNTAKSVDGLISRYTIGDSTLAANGTKAFFFESESSSQTSSRGVYLDPQFRNTGINQTPGNRGGSNYDNDFASWTMSNEYGLKKDRDRKSFLGQFIWTGFDYLGEPTPYSVYPVGVSSFGTIDTAGFPKDSFYLYQSQWTTEPMAHLLPQNWDMWQEGETVEVWVNTNQPGAELFLNGISLGKKNFDEKETADGRKYYETSEKTDDDKTWGDNLNPGGYTSPGAVLDEGEMNSGRLHLKWDVPYEPGVLKVVAYDKNGNAAAEDTVTTSGVAYTIKAVADKTVLKADGSSLSFVECTVTDEEGNMVADAGHLLKFAVSGGASIVGVDNGQQESTELYKYGNIDKNTTSQRTAYHGKALVILKSGQAAGEAVLTVSADGLKPERVKFLVTADGSGSAPAQTLVTGTASSVEPVSIRIPAGMRVTLPSAVKVNYTSDAGNYFLMRRVSWGRLSNGTAEGTVEGISQKASASVTEDSSAAVNTELAADASATATFTGSTSNYPSCMLDADAATSWTNAYNKEASVLLPAENRSRKSDTVTFSWDSRKVMNRVALTFTEDSAKAVPSLLRAEYWDGAGWVKAPGQIVDKRSGGAVAIQFVPVYTDRIRVYMENATPFTAAGNMAIKEASVQLSTIEMDPQLVLYPMVSVPQGEEAVIRAQIVGLTGQNKIAELTFAIQPDGTIFENLNVELAEGAGGTIQSRAEGAKNVFTCQNGQGFSDASDEFLAIRIRVRADAPVGSYPIRLADIAAKNMTGQAAVLTASDATVRVTKQNNPIAAAKAMLQLSVNAALELNERNYTVAAWQALLAQSESAQRVLADENATEAQIKEQDRLLQSVIRTMAVPGAGEYWELLGRIQAKEQEIAALKNASGTQNTPDTQNTAGTQNAAEIESLRQELATVKKSLEGADKTVIVADRKKYTVKRGKTVKIAAAASGEKKLSFTSLNPKVAKVSPKGAVKGIKKGSAKIVISAGKESITVSVKVK